MPDHLDSPDAPATPSRVVAHPPQLDVPLPPFPSPLPSQDDDESPSSPTPLKSPASAAAFDPLYRRRRLHPPRKLRAKLLFVLITVLLAICVYASFIDDSMGEVEASISCGFCLGLLVPLQALAHVGDDAFVDFFVGICTNLGIEDADVCAGAVGTQAPILAHDLRHISLASHAAKNFCSTVFGLCPLQEVIPYSVAFASAAPTAQAVPDGSGDQAPLQTPVKKWVGRGRKPFQVVHLSDVHVDRKYVEGSSAICSKVICCRDYGIGSVGPNISYPAGKFGNPNCDSPPALVESLFRAIDRHVPNRSFTIFTGDIIDAAVWAVNPPRVTVDMQKWYNDMEAPSYPALGNHDVSPVNSFPRTTSTTAVSSQWVFDLAAKAWEPWIGAEAAAQTASHYGCYATVHPGTNLRIISINTQYWYKQNFWLYDSDEPQWDPNGVLSWVASELHFAEQHGQRAWIMGHMPFGKVDALRDQSNYANQIFQRYASTIAAHFYGHSHADEFEISYPNYNDRRAETANGIAYISGSLTPASGNPVFRVYDVDPDTYEIMDFVPYYANVSEPSFNVDPVWKPYYSARESYGSLLDPPLQPNDSLNGTFWHRVTEVMERDEYDYVFQLYNTRLTRGGKVMACGPQGCKNRTICMMRSMRAENNCIVVRPGLSFKDSKRDPDAENPDAEDSFSALASHECEGPGLGSMLQRLVQHGKADALLAFHASAVDVVRAHHTGRERLRLEKAGSQSALRRRTLFTF